MISFLHERKFFFVEDDGSAAPDKITTNLSLLYF
jgi:hypothetical protein